MTESWMDPMALLRYLTLVTTYLSHDRASQINNTAPRHGRAYSHFRRVTLLRPWLHDVLLAWPWAASAGARCGRSRFGLEPGRCGSMVVHESCPHYCGVAAKHAGAVPIFVPFFAQGYRRRRGLHTTRGLPAPAPSAQLARSPPAARNIVLHCGTHSVTGVAPAHRKSPRACT